MTADTEKRLQEIIERRLQEVINAEAITLVSKRPPHWDESGMMDHLLGATLLVEELEVDVSWGNDLDPWVFFIEPPDITRCGWCLKLSDIVDYSSKDIKIQGKYYL